MLKKFLFPALLALVLSLAYVTVDLGVAALVDNLEFLAYTALFVSMIGYAVYHFIMARTDETLPQNKSETE
jgi:hypothetical protein